MVTLSITSLDGKVLHTQTIQPVLDSIEINWKTPHEQFLIYSIKGEKINFTGKVVGI
jgi:hypothetical protein